MKYELTEPYRAYCYIHHIDLFDKMLKKILIKESLGHFDYTAVLQYIAQTLDQIYLPDFVISFDSWLKEQPTTKRDRYPLYFKKDNSGWNEAVKGNNVFLEDLALHLCTTTVNNLEKFISRLKSEHHLLSQKFGTPALSFPGSIRLPGGDRHDNGQQPVSLSLGQHTIIYKPRDLQVEGVLNEICVIDGLEPACPETLSCGSHLWQAFVANRPLSNFQDAHKAYKRYGILLALADLLNINDCHYENFIVDGCQVYLIDPETSFQYYSKDGQDFERSVYQSGLLHSPDVINKGIGHTSAITAVNTCFQSYTYPHAINDATETIQVRYERGFKKHTQNYPHYCGKPVHSKKFIKDVIDGYESGYKNLTLNSEKILSLISEKNNIMPRYLIRTTSYYLLVINKILHPLISRNIEEKFGVITEDFLHYPGSDLRFNELIPYEAACLRNYDIPLFRIKINSTSLYNETGDETRDFFSSTPFLQICENFKNPFSYLERQRILITGSMNVHSEKN